MPFRHETIINNKLYFHDIRVNFHVKSTSKQSVNFFLAFSVLPLLIITAVIDNKKRLLFTKEEQLVSLYSSKN